MRFADSFLIMSSSISKCVLQYHVVDWVWSKRAQHEDLRKRWRKRAFLRCLAFQKCALCTVGFLIAVLSLWAPCLHTVFHPPLWWWFSYSWCLPYLTQAIPSSKCCGQTGIFTAYLQDHLLLVTALTLPPFPDKKAFMHVHVHVFW